ncbi:MAG: ATP-dependent helicase [Fidelibacterota bacterium]
MRIEPTRRQKAAIVHPPGPLLIIAGAGTGKTTTLILRIEHMIETGQVPPESIVVITYTERAAEELAARIDGHLGTRSEGITVFTFHALCRHLVAEYGTSRDAAKPLIRENDIVFLLLDRYDSLHMLTSQAFKSDPMGAVTGSFIPFFNRIRDELLLPTEVTILSRELELTEETVPGQFPGLSDKTDAQEYVRQFHDLVKVYETYQSWKVDLGVVDYGDMVTECWEMLRNSGDVLQAVRDRYRHIVVDEYQDNNYALNQIMSLIAGDSPDITVVGDEDQCIYSFRGANYYNIYDFKQRYGVTPENGEIWLEENHRSTREILDLANVAIESDRYRTPKKLVPAQSNRGPM